MFMVLYAILALVVFTLLRRQFLETAADVVTANPD
jgi:hypothetical protein